MRCCGLNSESKVVGSLTFVSSSDKRESFVLEAFVAPLLRRRAAVVGSVSHISLQIWFSDRMSSFNRWDFNLFQSRDSNEYVFRFKRPKNYVEPFLD